MYIWNMKSSYFGEKPEKFDRKAEKLGSAETVELAFYKSDNNMDR